MEPPVPLPGLPLPPIPAVITHGLDLWAVALLVVALTGLLAAVRARRAVRVTV
jgi:hypothetical protein